jgi:hypothetical protein
MREYRAAVSSYNVAIEVSICSPADVDDKCVNSATAREGFEKFNKSMVIATDNTELGMMLGRRLTVAVQDFIKEHSDELLQGWFTVKDVFEDKS